MTILIDRRGAFTLGALTIFLCLGIAQRTVMAEKPTRIAPAGVQLASAGWRTDGTGRYPDAHPPQSWSKEKNVRWKTPLPDKSHSAPIVVGNRIFVTAEPAELLCLDTEDGHLLWKASHTYADMFDAEQVARIESDLAKAEALGKQVQAARKEIEELKKNGADEVEQKAIEARIEELHRAQRDLTRYPAIVKGANGNTTSTPVSDGQHVYAVFGTGIVACHTLAGERVWMRWYEPSHSGHGHASSPLVVDGKLIVNLEAMHALDPSTGDQLWTATTGSRWGTPVAVQLGETAVVVTPGGNVVRAADGHMLAKGLFSLGHCSPIVHDGVVYAMEEGRTQALKLKLDGADTVKADKVWEAATTRERRFASPVCHAGLLYGITERGIFDVIDVASGKEVYRKRLPLGDGNVYPSPTVAGKLLYVGSSNGATLVVDPGREYRELAKNELEGHSGAPVFVGQRMYVRGNQHLYCIEDK